jgi:hypothetical protein
MENEPQQRRGNSVTIIGALAGMAVTFVFGVYVGLHPTWIPIKTSSQGDYSAPVTLPDLPHTQPTTAPTTRA